MNKHGKKKIEKTFLIFDFFGHKNTPYIQDILFNIKVNRLPSFLKIILEKYIIQTGLRKKRYVTSNYMICGTNLSGDAKNSCKYKSPAL